MKANTTALVAIAAVGLASPALLFANPPEYEAPGPCPAGMVRIDASYCIDAFEAHLQRADGQAHPFYRAPRQEGYRAVSLRGAYPQAHISQEQASDACRDAGKRLCSASEWQKACRGPEPTRYPYGVKWRRGYCNDNGVSPLAVLFGPDASAFGAHTMNDSRLNRVPGSLARAGWFGRCTNGYGVYDMVGNLHEWIADASGVMRGGYYLDVQALGEGCGYRTVGHAPAYSDYSTGFRCCAP